MTILKTDFRDCGECTACCTWLVGESYGHKFGNGISCTYLEECGCGIYENRPKVCINYQCAWSQNLFPEEMRPDKCGVLVSVENNEQYGQYLRVIVIESNEKTKKYINYLKMWSEKMNTFILFPKLDI